jgi:hypothetical protein
LIPNGSDIAHESEQDQANCDNHGRDDESNRGASPWSGDFRSGPEIPIVMVAL